MHHPTDRITHTTAFVTPVVEHWLEPEIAQWVRPMKDRSDDPSHHKRMLLPQSYILLLATPRLDPCITLYSNNTLLYIVPILVPPPHIIKDDKGVIIVLVPMHPHPSVRLFLNMPEKQFADEVEGFAVQWGHTRHTKGSSHITMEVLNSTYITKVSD